MKNAITIFVIACASLLSGCASIVNGTNQIVSVEARNNGDTVVGAKCEMDNGKGKFYVTTPGTVTVHRAYDDMQVKCEKDGMQPGMAAVKSSTKGMAFGNILFGGFIGAAVDAGSGAAYDYPTMISVIMGKIITIAPPSTDPAAQPTPVAAPASATPKVATPADPDKKV
jgi:hypothetical protein